MTKIPVASSWSGGKDSCLACYKAIKQGYDVKYLLNFISEEFKRVAFHGAKAELLQLQAKAIGIEIFQKETTPDGYEKQFIEAVSALREKGIKSLICGDIHLAGCREWAEKACKEASVSAIEPLWGREPLDVVNEFVDLDFQTIVTSTQSKLLGKEWIGRQVDKKFISDLQKKRGIDPCGENGEFHTFVFDGPLFKKRVEILKTDVVLIKGYWFLDIQQYRLMDKKG